jgi:hypothetical protein
MSFQPTLDYFLESKGSVFTIFFAGEDGLPAELHEVNLLPVLKERDVRPFSLIFLTQQKGHYYAQGTFLLSDRQGNRFPVFLVPVGPQLETGRMQYEAVFN